MTIKNRLFRFATLLIAGVLIVSLQDSIAESVNEAESVSNTKSTRIINGSLAKRSAWPWMVALLNRDVDDNYDAQFCGGSLIHPEWVVTAAHCFFENDKRIDENGTDILIDTNSLDLGGRRINTDRTIIHPGYSPDQADSANDIALLHLTEFVREVKPISLPGTSFDLPVVADGANSTVIGWGKTNTSAFPAELMQVDVPIVSEQECKEMMGEDSITSTMVCAGLVEGGKDACQGDSGGPLISSILGEIQLVGIVSWGYGCGLPGRAGVYTRVSKFENFITSHVCNVDQPARPELTVTHSENSYGNYNVTISFSEVMDAAKYRLYFTPYVEAGERIMQIEHIDMMQTIRFVAPPDVKYFVIGQAVNNNCVSDFSNLAIAPDI